MVSLEQKQTKHVINVIVVKQKRGIGDPETKKGELESLGVFQKNLCDH